MRIGIPKEIKEEEHRVAAIPAGVAELRRHGHAVLVESGAGKAIGFSDAHYVAAGAEVVATPAEVYAADLVYTVEFSVDLRSGWSPSPLAATRSRIDSQWERVRTRDHLTVEEADRRFVRIRVEHAP